MVIWLAGGPGQSSIWSIFSFNAVFNLTENKRLSLNPYAWAHNYSMLYIDNPVGTGYSFTRNESGYSRDMNSVANNLYEFLQQFYKVFNEYRGNDLYITGESYAGKYVPALGYKLMQMSDESNINFKGIALGNPWIDPINQLNVVVALKGLGLIDEKEMDTLKKIIEEVKQEFRKGNSLAANEKNNQMCKGFYMILLMFLYFLVKQIN